jgi:hypothetical protein
MSIHLQWFGAAALVFALAAHLRLGRWRRAVALAGLFAALLALVLYNVRFGAPALVLALLALAELGLFRSHTARTHPLPIGSD